jgi:hypothetical protein
MTWWEANEKYEGFREEARAFTLDEYCSTVFVTGYQALQNRLRFGAIDDEVLREWHAMRAHWNFPWDEIVTHFRKDTHRFEIAVWKDAQVAGLGIGGVSDGPDNVTIHFLERCQNHTPLKGWIAQIVTDAATVYGKILGKQRVKLKDPLPGARPTYEKLGFSLAENIGKTTYYERRISP